MILVVLNFLLLTGGSSGNGFMAWLNKISKPKPKKRRAKEAAGTFNVSGKRKRSSQKKGWNIGGVVTIFKSRFTII